MRSYKSITYNKERKSSDNAYYKRTTNCVNPKKITIVKNITEK